MNSIIAFRSPHLRTPRKSQCQKVIAAAFDITSLPQDHKENILLAFDGDGVKGEMIKVSLAGIKTGAPGFQTLEVAPGLTDRFDYVKASSSYESAQGRSSNGWQGYP